MQIPQKNVSHYGELNYVQMCFLFSTYAFEVTQFFSFLKIRIALFLITQLQDTSAERIIDFLLYRFLIHYKVFIYHHKRVTILFAYPTSNVDL